MSDLIHFDFRGKGVRTILREGQPWFVLADVCRVLEISNPRDAAGRLDDDEKHTVANTDGIAAVQVQQFTIINESGLYSLILTSRKPQAQPFKRWVTHDVLPALRQHGTYTIPGRAAELVPFTDPSFDALPLGVMQRVAVCEAVRRHSGSHAARALWVAWGLPLAPEVTGTPLDKAAAMAELRRGGARTATIAAAHGTVQRNVQIYLRMLTDLAEPVKQAMRDGTVNLSQARSMALLPKDAQMQILAAIIGGQDLREADIKLMARADDIGGRAGRLPSSIRDGE